MVRESRANTTIPELVLQDCKTVYLVTDGGLNVVDVGGAVDLLVREPHSCLGRSLPDVVPELRGFETVVTNVLAGEMPRFELGRINRTTDEGRTMVLAMATLPHQDHAGQITGVIHVMQNVSQINIVDQQQAEGRSELSLLRDELARQNLQLAVTTAELKHLDESGPAFVSLAAHQLRSPLTLISGYVEMLLTEDFGPLTDAQRQSLEILQSGAQRLLSTTRNLLDWSRIEAGQVELSREPTDMGALVDGIVADFGPRLRTKAQRVAVRVADDLPPALCDAARTEQIVDNLLGNAIKYTPQNGQITISLAPVKEEDFLRLSVADTGVGISAGDQEKLFTPFFRAKSAVRAQASGAGLGLYITKLLVELHNGRIWFDSEPGEGTTFFVTLPTTDAPV